MYIWISGLYRDLHYLVVALSGGMVQSKIAVRVVFR
jgi:hypothetical protein